MSPWQHRIRSEKKKCLPPVILFPPASWGPLASLPRPLTLSLISLFHKNLSHIGIGPSPTLMIPFNFSYLFFKSNFMVVVWMIFSIIYLFIWLFCNLVAVPRLSSCVHGLSCPVAGGILVPWPHIETTSLALQGRCLTTGPPWKSPLIIYLKPLSPKRVIFRGTIG